MAHFLLAYMVCVAVIYAAWSWVLIPYLDHRPPPVGRPWPVGQQPTAFAVAGGRIKDRPVDVLIVCARHGGEDNTGYIRLFQCDTWQMVAEFPVPGLGNNLLAASRNGRHLAVTIAYGEGNVRLYSLSELLKLRRSQQPHYRSIEVDKQPTAIAFSPDGRTLAVGTIEGTISIYNLERQEADAGAEYTRLWHHEEITALAFSPQDPAILVSSSAEGLTLWHSPDAWGHSKTADSSPDPVIGQALWQAPAPVTALAFNEEGILAAAAGNMIRLMRPSTPQEALDLSHPGVQALAFHGALLISTGREGKLWDLRQEEASLLPVLSLAKTPQALAYQGGARFVAWIKHFSTLLQVGLDDMARERPLSSLTRDPLPEAVSSGESWSMVSAPAPSIATAWVAPPILQPTSQPSPARPRPAHERRPLSPMQKLGVPVALCSAFLPTFCVYLLNRPLPPAGESHPATVKVDFPELNVLVQDARKRVQQAENSQKAGRKALAKTQWTLIQAIVSTINKEDHPGWFQKARQEQLAAAAARPPKPGPQNEALNDIAESRLDMAIADVHLNDLAAARKAVNEIERSYTQAQITEPDESVWMAPQAVQQDLPALQNRPARKAAGTGSRLRHSSKTRRRSSSQRTS